MPSEKEFKKMGRGSFCEKLVTISDVKIFTISCVMSRIKTNTKRRGRPTLEENTTESRYIEKRRKRGPCIGIPAQEIRLDGMDHFPVHNDLRTRCKYPDCKFKTMISCQKCTMPLCTY
ncbi:hypothetical protein QTP88_000241 [Uroleucon formosanum]